MKVATTVIQTRAIPAQKEAPWALLELLMAEAGATAATDGTEKEVEPGKNVDDRVVEVATSLDNVEGTEVSEADEEGARPKEEMVGYGYRKHASVDEKDDQAYRGGS
jgi:hypothetical protein